MCEELAQAIIDGITKHYPVDNTRLEIQLFTMSGYWMARWPNKKELIDMTGSDTIKTKFVSVTSPDVVEAHFDKDFPDHEIRVV